MYALMRLILYLCSLAADKAACWAGPYDKDICRPLYHEQDAKPLHRYGLAVVRL